MMKLFLSIFWLIVGVVFLLMESQPNYQNRTIIPLSWLAFLMALFNFSRWGGARLYQRYKKRTDDPEAPPIRRHAARPPRDEETAPNPELNFTEPPAQTAEAEEKPLR